MLLGFFQVYYIGGSGDGDLLWNTNAAYLLVHGERRGYHASYLGYVGELFKGHLGVADTPDDRTPFTLIIRITPSGIERYEEKHSFDFFTPLGQDLYAWGPGAVLWKWAGTHFEKANAEEQLKLGGTPHLPKNDLTDANGWSARYSITAKIKEGYSLQLDGAPITVTVETRNLSDGVLSVDLLRQGHSAEQIYYRSGRPRRVSKNEYERTFF